jgi:hypothetical protein
MVGFAGFFLEVIGTGNVIRAALFTILPKMLPHLAMRGEPLIAPADPIETDVRACRSTSMTSSHWPVEAGPVGKEIEQRR